MVNGQSNIGYEYKEELLITPKHCDIEDGGIFNLNPYILKKRDVSKRIE